MRECGFSLTVLVWENTDQWKAVFSYISYSEALCKIKSSTMFFCSLLLDTCYEYGVVQAFSAAGMALPESLFK